MKDIEPRAVEPRQLSRKHGDQVEQKRHGECSDIIGILSVTTTFVALDLELLCNIIARGTQRGLEEMKKIPLLEHAQAAAQAPCSFLPAVVPAPTWHQSQLLAFLRAGRGLHHGKQA